MFRVGQKVVFVGGLSKRRERHDKDPAKLTLGCVYTIRDIDHRATHLPLHEGLPTVRLEEVIAPTLETLIGPWEIGFDPRIFRPVQERKTDISIFHSILRKHTKRQGADA